MAKKKKKGSKKAWNRAFESLVKDNQLLLAIIGAVAGGIALAAAVGSERGKKIIGDVSDSLKDILSKEGQPLRYSNSKKAATTPSPAAAT